MDLFVIVICLIGAAVETILLSTFSIINLPASFLSFLSVLPFVSVSFPHHHTLLLTSTITVLNRSQDYHYYHYCHYYRYYQYYDDNHDIHYPRSVLHHIVQTALLDRICRKNGSVHSKDLLQRAICTRRNIPNRDYSTPDYNPYLRTVGIRGNIPHSLVYHHSLTPGSAWPVHR